MQLRERKVVVISKLNLQGKDDSAHMNFERSSRFIFFQPNFLNPEI